MSNTTAHTETRFGVVMQVKDEADVIQHSIVRWWIIGASAILVFDDGSTDGTFEILRSLESKYQQITVFSNPAEPYEMEKHINMMKNVLIHDDDIRWIISADVDEIWMFPDGITPSVLFGSLPQIPCWGEVPYYDNAPNGNRRLHTHRKCFGLFTSGMEISIGNHLVVDGEKWPKIENHGIYIEHFPHRSYEQMKRKLTNHMHAYRAQHPGHPNAQMYDEWQRDGEAFFQKMWGIYNF